jgi:hypothetical protein
MSTPPPPHYTPAAAAAAAPTAAAQQSRVAFTAGTADAAAAAATPVAAQQSRAALTAATDAMAPPPRTTAGLDGLLSPTRLSGHPPPGFSTRPLVADATWASTPLSTDSTMSSAIAAI